MSELHITPAVKFYGGLFSDCVTKCEAYAACGGHRNTMPCGCFWSSKSENRHKCNECYVICRERRDVGPDGIMEFSDHLAQSKMLEQVSLTQNGSVGFPLFVPMATSYFKDGDYRLPVRFAAADIQTLYNSQTLRSSFDTAQTARDHLRVDVDCELIAVLNGKDCLLENLWGMGEEKRRHSFLRLSEIGFSVGTGATYSVTGRTTEGRPTPHAHNVAMLMRHHQVVDEINASGLFAVPNLYWLDGDVREIQRWAKWLIKNPQICTISRDFTLTKNTQTVLAKLRELKYLLDLTGRSFNVMIIGTGAANAPLVVKSLAEAGHMVTIITSSPIYDARLTAQKYHFKNGVIIKEKDTITDFSELIIHNMIVFEQALLLAVQGTSIENRSPPNVLQVFGKHKVNDIIFNE